MVRRPPRAGEYMLCKVRSSACTYHQPPFTTAERNHISIIHHVREKNGPRTRIRRLHANGARATYSIDGEQSMPSTGPG